MTARWIVVVGLSVLVGALACSFSVDLGPEGGTPPVASTPTPLVAATPTPATQRSDADQSYYGCAVTVADSLEDLWWGDMGAWFRGDGPCHNVSLGAAIEAEAGRLLRDHGDCPTPTDRHLSQARGYLDEALSLTVGSVADTKRMCGGGGVSEMQSAGDSAVVKWDAAYDAFGSARVHLDAFKASHGP